MTSFNYLEIGKLYFEEGLPGFTHLQFFQIVQEEAGSPFFSMLSLEDEQANFWVVDPFIFFKEYEFTLGEQTKHLLRIDEHTPVAVLTITTLRTNGEVTTNLKAPIIINRDNRMARQVILTDETYQLRQPLFSIPTKAISE